MSTAGGVDDFRATPEVYRARAQASAGLATTGAAAVAAGAVFGGAANLTLAGQIAAVVAVALLLLSVIAYVAAANYTYPHTIPKNNNQAEIEQVVKRIKLRINAGSVLGLAAVLAFVVVVGSTVAWSTSTTPVRVQLTGDGLVSLEAVCPLMDSATLDASVSSSGSPLEQEFVPLSVDAEKCGGAGSEIFLPRAAIASVSER